MSDKRKLPPTSEEEEERNDDAPDETTNGLITPPPKKKKTKSSVEADLICPITLQLPIHPAVAGDGRIYESSAIQQYIKKNSKAGVVKSPITRENMAITYTESPAIKSHIETLIDNGSITGELAETWTSVNDQINEAKNGDGEAMYGVASSYCHGSDGFPKDKTKCFEWTKKSHDAGYIMGTGMYGLLLMNGFGTDDDESLGIVYLSIGAAGGADFAAYELGLCFAEGLHGLKVNKVETIKWLQVALSGECKFKQMNKTAKQKAKKLLDELLPGAGPK